MTDTININFVWGIILVSVTLKCWIGQIIIAFSPKVAAKIRILEPESNLDPAFFADLQGQVIWDAMSLWTLPIAGILILINNDLWTYFGLVGGGIYLYFAGRGFVSRILMQRLGIKIGSYKNLKMNYLFLTLWGFMAIITIILAIIYLT